MLTIPLLDLLLTRQRTTSLQVTCSILLDDIRRGSSKCVIPALNLGTVPDDGDQVIGLGDTKNINRVQTYYSDGVAICYVCGVVE